MQKTIRSLICTCLVLVMIASLSVAAFAATGYNSNSNPTEDTTSFTLTKHYELVGDTTNGESPAEDFTVTITPYKVENAPSTVTVENMPTFSAVSISAVKGTASTTVNEGVKTYGTATATVTLPTYTAIGDYWYTVKETAGATAGVTYDAATYYLHVQVIKSGENLLRMVTLHKPNPDAEEGQDPYLTAKTDGILNKYANGSLAVSKVVSGNMGDHTKVFNVDVTFTYASTDGENNPVKSEIAYTDDTAKTIAPASWEYDEDNAMWTTSVTIGLKHNETVTFTNIPGYVEYTVQEQDYSADGYVVPTYDLDKDSGSEEGDKITGTTWTDKKVTGKISDAEDTVTITNSKDTTIDVGVIVENAPYVALIMLVGVLGTAVIVTKRNRAAK